MTHDESLPERFPDLLGPQPADDPALARLVADLDALHAAHEPPATLASSLDRAIGERAVLARFAADQTSGHLAARHPRSTHRPPSEGRTPVTPRRLSALLGGLAAVLVVGLMSGLLLSGRANLGLGGPKGHETPEQAFARLGGVELVLRVTCPAADTGCDLNQRLPDFQGAVTRRAAGLSATEVAVRVALVKATYADVVVDLPGDTDQQKAAALLGASGELDVIDTGSAQLRVGGDVGVQLCASTCAAGQYKIVLTGADLDTSAIAAMLDRNTNGPIVTFGFSSKGNARQRFADYTRSHIGQYLTIALDGKVIESATIQSEIDGNGEITGIPTLEQAQKLVTLLKSPLPLTVADVQASYVKPGATSASSCATSTPAPMPTATPGGSSSSGQSSLIQNVVTATGVDNKFFPTGVTSHFAVNSTVYVVTAVRGVHPGETHTISIRWFFNGQDLQLPPTASTTTSVSGDRQIYFSLTYPQPGAGMAKIYVDRPASDVGDDPHDPSLAATIYFDVELQGAAPAPTVTPIAGGVTTTSAASAGCATPTDTATPESSGAATPSGTPTASPPATPTPTPPHA